MKALIFSYTVLALVVFAALYGCNSPTQPTIDRDGLVVGVWENALGTNTYKADGTYAVDRSSMPVAGEYGTWDTRGDSIFIHSAPSKSTYGLSYTATADSLIMCGPNVCDHFSKGGKQ